MMKKINYILSILLAAVAVACSETIPEPDNGAPDGFTIEGNKVSFSAALHFPEMRQAASRALAERPDYDNLHLYLLEFDDNGSTLSNSLTHVYEAQEETIAGDIVKFKVTLNSTDNSKILHLIALPKSESLNVNYGTEASIIPQLTVSGSTDAYWRRLEFKKGYVSQKVGQKWEVSEQLKQMLDPVPLIRNFAKISIENKASGFTFTGFGIINQPTKGSVAPWNQTKSEFPEFMNGNTVSSVKNFQTMQAEYTGYLPAKTELVNPAVSSEPVIGDTQAKYMYERPFNSVYHTYIIIRGRFGNDIEECYYKLDIGGKDNDNIFRYYDILRNFDFHININEVKARGYKSALEAANGVVYNNFSFDVKMNSLLNLSDGDGIVFVNFTTAVLTNENSDEILEFKYRYKNIAGNTFNNDDCTFIDLEPGEVIKSVNRGTTDDADAWRTVTITCRPATAETKTQSFIIVNKNGLGRTVNLVSHSKWEYINPVEYSGLHVNYGSEAEKGHASTAAKEPLTVFFDLPKNMPEAVFPLTFILESNRQNIENNPGGAMAVTEGFSFFDNAKDERRIKYQRIVTWEEYNSPLVEAGGNPDLGTIIYEPDGETIKTHRVHCRFRTITTVQNKETTVFIYNPNFVQDGSRNIVKFTRP